MKPAHARARILLGFALSFVMLGPTVSAAQSAGQSAAQSKAAEAKLQAAPKSKAEGSVSFLQTEKGTKVIAEIKGLQPGSVHGLHVHEKGQCEPPSFDSAGGHFNPGGQPHGAPAGEKMHVGDFGNVVANKEGVAKKELLLGHVKLEGKDGVMGKAVVLHAEPDDLISQPSGNAGARIACGVIKSAKSAPKEIERK